MVECREVIMLCRQIGGMMEAGVDILRITRVLRAQTQNPRLLEVYDSLDHDMRMGQSLAEAMSRAPDVFSPFIVSLVQQGEARNDLSGSFLRIADHLQKEEESNAPPQRITAPPPELGLTRSETATRTLTRQDLMDLVEHLQMVTLRLTTLLAGLLLSLAGVWWLVEIGWVERRWLNATLCSVAALFIAGAGVWVRRRIEADHRGGRCSVCGSDADPGAALTGSPAGVNICWRCAAVIVERDPARRQDDPRTIVQPEPQAPRQPSTSGLASPNLNGQAAPGAPAAPREANYD